jgi:hypothetical protein
MTENEAVYGPAIEPSKYRSAEIDKIAGALAAAQGTYKELKANEVQAGRKFANLRATLLATKDSLASNGLGFYQYEELLGEGAGAVLLWSNLIHTSGQWISSCARIVAGQTDKQTGNRLEIYKRIHAQMLLGIAPSDGDPISFDDGGDELAEEHIIQELRKPNPPEKPIVDRDDPISKDQYNELLIELQGYDKLAKEIMETYSIETLADLPRSEYHKARSQILKIKKVTEEFERKR